MTWTTCKRLILQHLHTGTDARVVMEGDIGTVAKRPTVLLADVDGGEPQFSVRGGTDYSKTVVIKVLADNEEQLETLMRQVRRCWEKDSTASQARMQALTTAGTFNVIPISSGENSLPESGKTKQEYEGLVSLTFMYRETA